MNLTIKIDEINYGDVAVKAMPLLREAARKQNGAVGKLLGALTELPEYQISDLLDAISVTVKNEIISDLATEHSNTILRIINDAAYEHQIGVVLSNYTLNRNLVMEIDVHRINYPAVAERFLPVIREKLMTMGGLAILMRPLIAHASAEQICDLMDRFLGDNKNAFVVSLINQNQNTLISAIESAAMEQNIRLKIGKIHAE